MNIHEHQAKGLLRKFGVSVPDGYPAFTVEEAVNNAKKLPGPVYVVKAQIHAGGRGKAGGVKVVKSIKLVKKFKNVEILWASVREPYNYTQAKQLGCHIITVPPSIIEKIEKFGKSLNKLTLETVKTFLIDSKKSNFKI